MKFGCKMALTVDRQLHTATQKAAVNWPQLACQIDLVGSIIGEKFA